MALGEQHLDCSEGCQGVNRLPRTLDNDHGLEAHASEATVQSNGQTDRRVTRSDCACGRVTWTLTAHCGTIPPVSDRCREWELRVVETSQDPKTITQLTWTLRAIARMERDTNRALRRPRLTETGWSTWRRIAGRAGTGEFIRLLHDDLAGAFPTAFDLHRWSSDPLVGMSEADATALAESALVDEESDTVTFLRAAAAALGMPAAGSVSSLPKVQAHQRVVELPGTGGRIAAQQVLTHIDLSFDRQFVYVADTFAERLLIGIAALELRSNPPEIITTADLKALLATDSRIDRAFGLQTSTAAEVAADAVRAAGKEVRCV